MPLSPLLAKNRAWADAIRAEDPDFFKTLSEQQNPDYLWIGCSDSRVPANQIVGLLPGELFVHRNVANMVIHTDYNCLTVIEYAVEALKVSHIIVCGHYGCGGVKGSMGKSGHGLIDNWLKHIKDVYQQHREELDAIEDESARADRLCELNVLEQVRNVSDISIIGKAWSEGRKLSIHGWVYGLGDGHLKDLGWTINNAEEAAALQLK